jgi:ribosomal protein S18 acetylase RimI-like enzyme
MSHILDNMIWNAITTGNRNIAILDGEVGFYQPDIAPFAGLKELRQENLDKLTAIVPAGNRVAIAYPDTLSLDESKWTILHHMDVTQMVYEEPLAEFTTDASPLIVPLSNEHIPAMLELTALTKPGPFLQRTILFGNYFGIFVDGRLAAMAGQRMHPIPYMEVSAVCTHPDFRGHGYARALMLHVMEIILSNGFTPFLHVLTSNTSAISLYEFIGFRIRKRFFIDVVKRVAN